MKQSTLFITLLLLIVVKTQGCKSTKETEGPESWKGEKIQFGYGGGFTGASMLYTLLPNGKLFLRKNLEEKDVLLKRIEKKVASGLFKSAKAAEFPAESVKDPGNMYTTLNFHTKEKQNNLTWGGGNFKPAQSVADLYKSLFELTASKTQ